MFEYVNAQNNNISEILHVLLCVIFTAYEPERKHLPLCCIPFRDGSKVLTYMGYSNGSDILVSIELPYINVFPKAQGLFLPEIL